jgi:DNA polymerase I-like protein with 3'-5' exonuclease and polymerase domains
MLKKVGGINVHAAAAVQKIFDLNGWAYWFNWQCSACLGEWPGPSDTSICPLCGDGGLVKRSPHFGKDFLKTLELPFAKDLLRARKINRLLSTYLEPWLTQMDDHGVWRYQLNQLARDTENGATYGTISGRFSASTLDDIGEGAQPQQIWSVEKQEEELGTDYILRELFIPDDGAWFCSGDASQIEFRLFGHYSKSDTIVNAYQQDPWTDFHLMMATNVLRGRVPRKQAKNVNFMRLYGGGNKKLSRMVGCTLREAEEMGQVYDELFPEAKELTSRAQRFAEDRGYVYTLYGRRARFRDWKKTYAALNRIIQGSAADVMKERLVALYESGLMKLRVTVHDEINGDIEDQSKSELVTELLNDFSIPLRVPLLWKIQVGKNWAMR